MPLLTLDECQKKIETVAHYDEATLQKATVKELRTLASGIVSGSPSRMLKGDIVEAILVATKDARARLEAKAEQEKADAIAQQVKAEEDLRKLSVSDLQTPDHKTIAKAYRGTQESESVDNRATRLFEQLQTLALSVDDENLRLSKVSDLVLSHTTLETSCYVPTTVKSNATAIKKTLTELAQQSDSMRVAQTVLAFTKKYANAVSGIVQQVNELDRARVATQQQTLKDVDGVSLLKTANLVLRDPASHHWTEVSKALALVTGRRSAEIHSSARFEPVDDGYVRFSGQLKTKGREGVSAYEIPTLVNSDLVIRGVDHLASLGRRYETTKDSDAKVSKPLSRAMEGLELTYKDYRAIYAEISWLALGQKLDSSKNAYFQRILGHGSEDVVTAGSYQKFIDRTDAKTYESVIAETIKP